MIHRTNISHDWQAFTAWLNHAETDGWHLVHFQIVPKDARNDALGISIYAVIARENK